jgi:hypothetical protein
MTDEELLAMANDNQREGRSNISEEQLRQFRAQAQVAAKRVEFFKSEGVAATLEVARIGDGGTIFVQGGGPRDKNAPQVLPAVVVTPEHYGRIARMLAKGVKVKVELNTVVKFYDDDPMSYNTVAEIPGTDKKKSSSWSEPIWIPGIAERERPTMGQVAQWLWRR